MGNICFMHHGVIIANELLTLCEKMYKGEICLDTHHEFIKCLENYMHNNFDIILVAIPHENGFQEWSEEHGDYFEMFQKDNRLFVQLKPNAKTDALRKRFRSVLPYESLKMFIDCEPQLIQLAQNEEKILSNKKYPNTFASPLQSASDEANIRARG